MSGGAAGVGGLAALVLLLPALADVALADPARPRLGDEPETLAS
jgi:hypothetical protein